MTRRLWSGLFIAGSVLVPANAFGQQVQERGADAKVAALPGETAQQILTLTNQFRHKHDRGELKSNPQLKEAAAYFADFLGRSDKFSHTADGKEPWDRAAKYGYQYCIVLENIAYEVNPRDGTAAGLAGDFVKGWEKSPGHRKNLLDPDVTETGVAVARGREASKFYAVQLFGRPKSAELVFKVSNETDTTLTYSVDGKPQTIEPRVTITHRQCRPPKLEFQPGQGKENKPAEKAEVIRPANGSRYALRADGAGGYTIKKE